MNAVDLDDVIPREELESFIKLMEVKLQENNDKGEWRNESFGFLLRRIKEEILGVEEAISKLTMHTTIDRSSEHYEEAVELVKNEAADVANFAMMIADLANETKE